MKSDDIIMKTGIVHILDSSVGVPVLSDCPIDLSGDLSDFLKAHIEKLTESDDVKLCRFGNDSPVKQLLEQCTPETFVETSKQLAQLLYDIMNANIDIPPADVAVVVFSSGGSDYLALLVLIAQLLPTNEYHLLNILKLFSILHYVFPH